MIKINLAESTKDKIDVESLLSEYRVPNAQTFASYLKEIWRVKIFFY